MQFRPSHILATRGVCLLLTAVLLSLCLFGLAACSDEVYDPTQDTLILNEGTGQITGNGNLELPTEPPTGSVIEIPNTDPFEGAPHVLRADFLNTGNSDAILIRMDETVILVDTGEADDYPAISRKLTEYGITKLATRISELKKLGHQFTTVMVTEKNRYGEPVRFARYWRAK